jgi:hypothetical protein
MNTRYEVGDWFAVPLRDHGFAAGVVARANKAGVLLGFFFGPRRATIPPLLSIARLRPEDAVLVRKFGHLGLVDGTWPVIGRSPGWSPTDWPMPAFVRHEELTGRYFAVVYDDGDPNHVIAERAISSDDAGRMPAEGMSGHVAMENRMTRLLD